VVEADQVQEAAVEGELVALARRVGKAQGSEKKAREEKKLQPDLANIGS